MKRTAYITDINDRLAFIDIPIFYDLQIGDYIKFLPDEDAIDNNNNKFTNDEVDYGIDLIVKKRVYSTIDGMMYYCEYAKFKL